MSAATRTWPPRTTVPCLETTRSTSTASPGSIGGNRGWAGVDGAVGDQPGQVGHAQVGSDGLDPGAADEQVDQVAVGPEPDDLAGPDRAEPELTVGDLHVPRWRHDLVELDRSTRPEGAGRRTGVRVDCPVVVGACLPTAGRGGCGSQRRRQPDRQHVPCRRRDRAEPVRRADRQEGIEGLVGAVGVVLGDESVDRGLRRRQRLERFMIIKQFTAEGEVEPFDLPGGGRRRRLGQPVSDRVVAADLVEQHLTALAEPVGELFPVVSQDLLRHPEPGQGAGQGETDSAAGGPLHHRRDHTEPGMVIDTGDDLHLAQHPGHGVDQPHAADDVDLPQLHRRGPFPPPIRGPGPFPFPLHDQTVPDQDPVHRRRRRDLHVPWWLLQHLHPDPLRTPAGMLASHLRHQHRYRVTGLMRAQTGSVRAIRQPGDPLEEIAPQPRMHTHPGHPDRGCDLGHRRARQDGTDRVQTLLNLRQDNQSHSRPPRVHGAHEHRPQDRPITARC